MKVELTLTTPHYAQLLMLIEAWDTTTGSERSAVSKGLNKVLNIHDYVTLEKDDFMLTIEGDRYVLHDQGVFILVALAVSGYFFQEMECVVEELEEDRENGEYYFQRAWEEVCMLDLSRIVVGRYETDQGSLPWYGG